MSVVILLLSWLDGLPLLFARGAVQGGDPRNAIFHRLSSELSRQEGGMPGLIAASEAIEAVMEVRGATLYLLRGATLERAT